MSRTVLCRSLITLSLLCLAGGSVRGADGVQPTTTDYTIIRASVKTPQQLQQLEATGGRILDCIPHLGKLDVLVTPEQRAVVENLGVATQVVERHVTLKRNRAMQSVAAADPFTDFFLDYRQYGSAAEPGTIVWYLGELATRYPTLASVIQIGTTLEGRIIWGLRIANDATGTNKPGVVYFGAEHSREWVATHITNFFATHLLENYGTEAKVTDLVNNVEFFLIPVFNVDGYLYTWSTDRFWRKNRRYNGLVGGSPSYGVDINRNWGEGWGLPGASTDPNSETYRGSGAFSEPETQVMRDFFLAHPNVRAQLDIHNYTQLILWPYGYTATPPQDQTYYTQIGGDMQSLIKGVHGQDYAMGSVNTAIYPVSGGSLDWTYAVMDILSYSYEMRPSSSAGGGFELPIAEIIPACEELVPAMLHLTNSEWVRSSVRFEFAGGRPETLTPGMDTPINLRIIGQTESVIAASAKLHYRYGGSGPFVEAPLTWLGGNDFLATLPATNCLSTPEYYFSVQDGAGATVVHPRAAPVEPVFTANMVSDNVSFFSENLDVNPGWTASGQWAWGTPLGGGGAYGGPDPTSGHTGTSVYGYNLAGDYPSNLSETNLTTAAIDCTGRSGVRLSFWRWLGVEQPAWDHAYVRVSADGTNWTTVWNNTAEVADTAWTWQDIDISAIADGQPQVYLRWTMGTTDTAWEFCGWNIDDISLTSTLCNATLGDDNGDGIVGTEDVAPFELCYTEPDAPFGPGCAIFDFTGDGVINCSDWSAFVAAWGGGGPAPTFAPCAPAPQAIVTVEGSRHLSITCPSGLGDVSVHVTSPDYPCLDVYAATDGTLYATPQTANSNDWQNILIAGRDVVPNTTYHVEVIYTGGTVSPPTVVTTMPWGDLVEPHSLTNFRDINASVKCFLVTPDSPPLPWCDIHPEVPDGLANFRDISDVVQSFLDEPYPFGVPTCP